MPIVDGQYEAKISTIFRTTEKAVEEIKNKIQKSKRVRISNIPMELLKTLLPLPDFALEIINAGGLLEHIKKKTSR